METTLVIKNILLPKLEKDSKFSEEKVDTAFWEKFTTDLLHFEEDAKPLYAGIYSLELDNPEKIIDKLPNIYAQFLKELAESYVLDQTSDATDYLLKMNNEAFLKEVHFLQTMQQAIKSVERKRIKADLPKSYERLTFELSETDLANTTKKKGREDLREKMKQWDKELVEESVPVIAMRTTEPVRGSIEPTKPPPFNWVRFAVAASIIIAVGVFFFRNTNQVIAPNENTIVTSDAKKDSTQPQNNIPVKEAIVLAEVETLTQKVIVQQSESMGFSSTTKPKITITYKDARQRIASLEKYIAVTSLTKDSATLEKYKIELIDLKKPNNNYIFDGKTLTLFSKFNPKQDAVLVTDDQNYYLKKGSVYYNLKSTKVPLPLEKVTNASTLKIVEKITFENE